MKIFNYTSVLTTSGVALALVLSGCGKPVAPAAAKPEAVKPAPAKAAVAKVAAEPAAKAPVVAAAPVPEEAPAAVKPAAKPVGAHGVLPAKVAKDAKPVTDSVYLVTSAWRDQSNKPTVLADLRGHVVVVAMVFTHCKYACPRIVADMQKIEKKLTPAQKADVRFLLVSMDPERDTPERLTGFAKEHKLDLSRWTLLTGPAGDVRVLNAVLGGRYKKAPSGDFAHSNMVIVLDRAGRIVHRQEGLELAPTEAMAAIGKIGPASK